MFDSQIDLVYFIIVCVVLFLVLSSLIVIFTIKFQERRILFMRSFRTLQEEHLNEILKVEMEVQEQTFQNISRELHDNIGQKLSYARLKVNFLKADFPQLDEELSIINDSLGEVISDIRDLSRSKSADFIYSNGLLKAIEREIEQIKSLKKFDLDFIIKGETYFLEDQAEITIFRVIQEGIHNIIKHSEANNISISMNFEPQALEIQISDDGKGFDRNIEKDISLGILNMTKRVERLGGKISIGNNQPRGTQILFIIPKK